MTVFSFRPLRAAIVLTIWMTLGACASTSHHPAAQDQLVTNITSTGQKQFTFIETRQHSNGGGRDHSGMDGMGRMGGGFGGGMAGGGGMGGGGMGGRGMGGGYAQDAAGRLARMQTEVKQRLEAKLAATAYCRNGYRELASQFQRGQIQIKGQCVEPATTKDRTRFPNSGP